MSLIKFHRIDRLYFDHRKEILAMVDHTFKQGQVLKSEDIERLEKELATLTTRKYAVMVGSCTDALFFAIKATLATANPSIFTLEQDHIYSLATTEIGVTPFTFKGSHTCIDRLNAIKTFYPIENDYFMWDLNELEKRITSKIKVLIVVNLFGQMMNMDRVLDIANRYNLIVIEDAAQSFTSHWKNKPAGSFGDASCLSFDPTKIMPAFATGGCVLTDNKDIGAKVREIHYKNYGCNSQISSVQAKLLLYWLPFIKQWENKRKSIADQYLDRLKNIEEIKLPQVNFGSYHIWHKFVIQAQRRNELKEYLYQKGIETKIHYSPHSTALSLPIYPNLYYHEVETITQEIKQFYSK